MVKIVYSQNNELTKKKDIIIYNYKSEDVNNNINLNNYMSDKQWKKLFELVWGNMILFKLISKYAYLYKINEHMEFNSRDQLLQYKNKEYIHKIIYHDNKLEIGDLPINGVLKEVHFKNMCTREPFNGKLIPYGVEIVHFHFNLHTILSSFPSTVHTVKGVAFDENYSNKVVNNNNFNLESISFIKCPKVTYYDDNDNNFKLPKTLKELNLPNYWDNEGLVLKKHDIPYGVEKLSMTGYRMIKNLPKDVLPNSIKELEITANDNSYLERGILTWFSNGYQDIKGLFNCLPINLEILTIHIYNNCIISPNSLLVTTCTKLKSLSIISLQSSSILKSNSLPPSITKLFINDISNLKIEVNSIPSNVKKLTLLSNTYYSLGKGYLPNSIDTLKLNKLITTPDILPKSLKHIKICHHYYDDNLSIATENLIKMISILPWSIQTIKLPRYIGTFVSNNYNQFSQSTISKIKYYK